MDTYAQKRERTVKGVETRKNDCQTNKNEYKRLVSE